MEGLDQVEEALWFINKYLLLVCIVYCLIVGPSPSESVPSASPAVASIEPQEDSTPSIPDTENPLTCRVCGKTLSRKSSLINHLKKIHGQVRCRQCFYIILIVPLLE